MTTWGGQYHWKKCLLLAVPRRGGRPRHTGPQGKKEWRHSTGISPYCGCQAKVRQDRVNSLGLASLNNFCWFWGIGGVSSCLYLALG